MGISRGAYNLKQWFSIGVSWPWN